jgi:hypothetical protein
MKRKTARNSDQKLDRKGLGIPLETAKTRESTAPRIEK